MDKISTTTDKLEPEILVGTENFESLRLNSDVFVDKTMLIKAFIKNSSETILITRPRRWGKSMNLDMIAKFLAIEVDEYGNRLLPEQRIYDKLFLGGEVATSYNDSKTKLLKPLKISACSEIIADYQGQWPVIQLGFKSVKGSSYAEIEDGIMRQVVKAFRSHRYLISSNLLKDEEKAELSKYIIGEINLGQIKDSLKFLSDLLKKHYGLNVYILIDEYDTPINSAYIECYENNRKDFDRIIMLFQGIFGETFKGNTSLKKGFITGILRVAKANLFSGLNNISEDCLLDSEFAKYYGFTENEVEELLLQVSTQESPEEIKKWYNGYHMGKEIIYNPWSIMQCLRHNGEVDHYWLDSGGTQLIDKVLLSDDVQEELQLLLEHKPLIKKIHKQIAFDEFERNSSIFYSLLLFAGYLNAKPTSDNKIEVAQYSMYNLSIPNLEVHNIYIARVIGWLGNKVGIDDGDYELFIDLLTNKKLDQFMFKLSQYMMNSTSYHDLTQEKDYHNLMGGILSPLVRKYIVSSNKEFGTGRCDHVIIPLPNNGDTAFIFEYKKAKTKDSMETESMNALTQINQNEYDSNIKTHSHVKCIIKIGMAFYGKEFGVKWKEHLVTLDDLMK